MLISVHDYDGNMVFNLRLTKLQQDSGNLNGVKMNTQLSSKGFKLLQKKIHDLFILNARCDDIMSSVAVALAEFGKVGIKSLLNEILQSPSQLAQLASSSYLHQNGFYKLPLYEAKEFSLRLNIWMPGTDSKETLHSHRWHIASYIADGTLVSETWGDAVYVNAPEYVEYLYVNKFTEPIFLDKARVRLDKIHRYTAGQVYTLDASTLHRIISQPQTLQATLMCHSFCVKSFARNIIVNEQIPDVRPQYLSDSQLKNLLNDYMYLSSLESKEVCL